MNEILQRLFDNLRSMWHRRWIGLTAAWIAAIIGVAVVYKIPERYEASARSTNIDPSTGLIVF